MTPLTARKNPPIGLTCRPAIKKVYLNEKNSRYISPLTRKALNGRICPKFCKGGRLADVIICFKFSNQSVDKSWICEGSNFAILYWQSVAINTGLRYRACDMTP